MNDPDQLAIATIRGLAMDAPHAARSGHQGTAMALAPLAHVLWQRIMRYDPTAPSWPDRDRFILSCGHGSILLYAMLHLTGYDLSLDDIKAFRQWDSKTPGHPEAGHLPGVEVTTGPLGQGFGNAVGMAITERWLRQHFSSDLCDHYTYVLCSDGDLAEGVSHEAASLAGHLGLGRLICIYDDNRVSIDGTTEEWLSDDPVKRFEAYGWHTTEIGDSAEYLNVMEKAVREAKKVTDAPSMLVLRSHIAYPSPELTDNPATHGYALFDEEIASAKQTIGIPADETFWVPEGATQAYAAARQRGLEARLNWEERLASSEAREEFKAAIATEVPEDWLMSDNLSFTPGESIATRVASSKCLGAIASVTPHILAGGADLTGNTGTKLPEAKHLSRDCADGQQIFFGVREHAMAATMVGIAQHGGLIPVGGTFLVFSDYMRPSVRLAALSGSKAIFVWSHDSVAVGEDGPTHQPVEHISSLRAIPGLSVIRPADAKETVGAWQAALENHGPTALILTRQNVPVLDETSAEQTTKGAYVLANFGDDQNIQLVLIGTGSEVSVCLDAAKSLSESHNIRVVSMPSWDLFASQPDHYQDAVLPTEVSTLSVEAGSTHGWHRWADEAIGIDSFGASAPGHIVMAKRGITPEAVIAKAEALIARAEAPSISRLS